MGKSAKLHKRVSKKLKSNISTTTSTPTASSSRTQVDLAKKRSSLKEKVKKDKTSASSRGGVLGDADYVSLMMGGRKKAREEAKKLPRDSA